MEEIEMSENETALVTELTFETDTILNAALFISSMAEEGQNNHKIMSVEFMGPIVEGTVTFNLPNTPDLRLWVETKAEGIGSGKFGLSFETVDLLKPVPVDPIPAVATA
jgi:hypothetical protein